MDSCVWEPLMPPSIDVILERLDGIRAEIRGLSDKQETMNGRVGRIEIDRAKEAGAREAVATAAASTAAALALREKSTQWKIGACIAAVGSMGGVVTIGTLAAHFILHH